MFILFFLILQFKIFLVYLIVIFIIGSLILIHLSGRAGKILDITQKIVTTIAAGTIAYKKTIGDSSESSEDKDKEKEKTKDNKNDSKNDSKK
jgi:uncharacterized membrane protein